MLKRTLRPLCRTDVARGTSSQNRQARKLQGGHSNSPLRNLDTGSEVHGDRAEPQSPLVPSTQFLHSGFGVKFDHAFPLLREPFKGSPLPNASNPSTLRKYLRSFAIPPSLLSHHSPPSLTSFRTPLISAPGECHSCSSPPQIFASASLLCPSPLYRACFHSLVRSPRCLA